MEGYGASTYGDRIAEVYDELYAGGLAVEEAVALLKELSAGGRVLELAVGTGRVALALRAAGVDVEGIDNSEAMVEKLRAKPGGDQIPVAIGDFKEVRVEGDFSMIFVVFNTIFVLTSQEDQIRCFENVAAHLSAGGAFVVEAFVPDLTRFDRDQRVSVKTLTADRVDLEVARHDAAAQTIASHHLRMTEGGLSLFPVSLRYAYPSELDLMARLAGLRLDQRWSDWRKTPFGSSSASHVSVYVRD